MYTLHSTFAMHEYHIQLLMTVKCIIIQCSTQLAVWGIVHVCMTQSFGSVHIHVTVTMYHYMYMYGHSKQLHLLAVSSFFVLHNVLCSQCAIYTVPVLAQLQLLEVPIIASLC